MLGLALLLAALAMVLLILAARQRQKAGLPPGKIIYVDASQWSKVEKPLFDGDLRLAGKPDYIVKKGRQVIPVEVKSRIAPQSPYDSHVHQLIAYCMLVDSSYHSRPKHGILHYTDKSFAIAYTARLEKETREMVQGMQEAADLPVIPRSHQDAHRCRQCGYRSICDDSLRI